MADEAQSPVTTAESAPAAPVASTPASSPPKLPSEPGPKADVQRAALEATVGDKLKEINWGDRDSESVADAPAATAAEPVVEATAETEKPVAETEEPPLTEIEEVQEGDKTKPKDQQPAVKPAGPTVPDAYRRTLKAYEWTDEEIDASQAANPAQFLVMAQKIHANRTAETSRWADLGRQAIQREKDQQPAVKPTHVDPNTGLFKPLDTAAMIEKYGNEDMVNEMAGPLNAMIEQFNQILPTVMGGVQSINQSRQENLARQVDQFFGQDSLKPFEKVYGKADSMEPEQIQNRNKVLETADALIAGAALQNRKLSITDALLIAHDHVGSGFRKETVRQEIKQTVSKRSASLTVKPSTTAKPSAGAPKSSTEMEARTRQRLASVFAGT